MTEGRWGLSPTVGKDGDNASHLLAVVLAVFLGVGVLLLISAALWGVAVFGVALATLGVLSVAAGLIRMRRWLKRTRPPGGAWEGAHLILSGALEVVAGVAVVVAFGV
ncbi:MAG: hypothetical protein ACRDOS_01285 [Gaiellaceae bacterium]